MKNKCLKVIALLLVCILVLFTGCSTSSLAGSDENTYDVNGNEASVTAVTNKSTISEIIIPDEHEGVPVTKIDDFAAVNLEYVTKITIGNDVHCGIVVCAVRRPYVNMVNINYAVNFVKIFFNFVYIYTVRHFFK
jgi:Flp pilus assembly protein TadG